MSARGITLTVAIALFVVVCVLPPAYMFGLSFVSPDGTFTFANYTRLALEARQRELLLTSAELGLGAAALATALGVPLGYLLARAQLPMRWLLRMGLAVPLVIPPYVLALGWIYLTGLAGLLPSAYSLPAAILVLGVAFYPLCMLATEATLRRVNGSLEEAALLIAPAHRVAARITLPLVAPAVTATALIVFALAVAEFGVPGLLRVRVFTTEVFTAFAALYDFGRATALAVPLLLVTLLAAVLAKRLAGEQLLAAQRTPRPGLRLELGGARSSVIAAMVLFAVAMAGLPIVALASRAKNVLTSAASSWSAIATSLALSGIAATLVVFLGLLLGHARARSRGRGAPVADFALIAVFAVPSTVVGIGLIGLWNRPMIPLALYASPAIIVLAYMARFVPVGTLILAAAVRQVPMSTEEAAATVGASWGRCFVRVVVPQLRGAIAAAWVAVFILAFGELGATVLVTPPGESTLPVRVYTLIANAPSGEVASLALVQVLAVVTTLLIVAFNVRSADSAR